MANQFSCDYHLLIGQKYGRFTILEKAPSIIRNGKYCSTMSCLCECGAIKIVAVRDLKNGNTKSCGCLKRETKSFFRHGFSSHRLYKIWSNIKLRCYKKSNAAYKDYGGRGIKMCDEWKNNAKVFIDWALANGYEDNLTIERIEVNGHYEPGNCKWVTLTEQTLNKRNSCMITHNNKIQNLSIWCKELGLPYATIRERFNKGIRPNDGLFKRKGSI